MKVVLLAGGFGTRISEESQFKPKPMVEIGEKPILWHIMKEYAYYGFNEFIVCAGYKQHVIKEWFADYFLHNSDITFDFTKGTNDMIIHDQHCEPWKVTVVDTGLNTMTGGRIKRIQKYVGKGSFVSFFISSKTVKRVGLPIKEFFIWYDDSEYSRRIVENENIGYLVADSRVLHKMGSNSKVDIVTENGDRLQRYRMAYRNRYYLNKGKGIKIYVKYYIHLLSVICNVIKNAPDNKSKRVNMIVLGTLDGIKFNPPIERLD